MYGDTKRLCTHKKWLVIRNFWINKVKGVVDWEKIYTRHALKGVGP
jgi:hypothetical protein